MGTVVQLKNQINNSYFQLKDSVEEKLALTEERITSKLISDVQFCLLYTSPSPRDQRGSRMPSSA